MLTSKPPDPSRLARWKQDMSPEDIDAFESVAGAAAPRARLRGDRRRRGEAAGRQPAGEEGAGS